MCLFVINFVVWWYMDYDGVGEIVGWLMLYLCGFGCDLVKGWIYIVGELNFDDWM